MKHFKPLLEDLAYGLGKEKEVEKKKELSMNLGEFAKRVEQFSSLGKNLYESGNFLKLAKEINDIAENAEAYIMKEGDTNWFDGITVKRNMKELKNYVNEFVKVATEAQKLNQRMTGLYEDSGRVLGRYFDIKDGIEGSGDLAEPHSEAEKQLGLPDQPSVKMETNYDVDPARADAKRMSASLKRTGERMDMERLSKRILDITDKIARAREAKKQPNPSDINTLASLRNQLKQKRASVVKSKNESIKLASLVEGNTTGYSFWIYGPKTPIKGKAGWDRGEATWEKKPKKRIVIKANTAKDAFATARKQYPKDKWAIDYNGIVESIKTNYILVEDVNDDYPGEDWVPLDVPKLRYESAKEFESALKKEGYKVLRKDWKERMGNQTEFAEFFVPLAEYNEANEWAVTNYKDYDIHE